MRETTAVEQQWLFRRSDLDRTPSRRAGMSYDEEMKRRETTIEYIRELGPRSGLGARDVSHPYAPVEVTTAASTMVHRFYMRRSFTDFDEKLIAPTILFITSKTEEESLKLRHIVNACLAKWVSEGKQWHVDPHNKENFPPQSREYQAWEREILAAEEVVLDALCFDLSIVTPWPILSKHLAVFGPLRRSLKKPIDTLQWVEDISNMASTMLNSAQITPLGILYHPFIAALGTFALAYAEVERVDLEAGLAAAGEVAIPFGVDVDFSEQGITGADADLVRGYCDAFIAFGKEGRYDVKFWESSDSTNSTKPYLRRFEIPGHAGTSTGTTNGTTPQEAMANGVTINGPSNGTTSDGAAANGAATNGAINNGAIVNGSTNGTTGDPTNKDN